MFNHMMTNNENLWDAGDSTPNTSADRNSFAHAHSGGPRTVTSVTTGALCLAWPHAARTVGPPRILATPAPHWYWGWSRAHHSIRRHGNHPVDPLMHLLLIMSRPDPAP